MPSSIAQCRSLLSLREQFRKTRSNKAHYHFTSLEFRASSFIADLLCTLSLFLSTINLLVHSSDLLCSSAELEVQA